MSFKVEASETPQSFLNSPAGRVKIWTHMARERFLHRAYSTSHVNEILTNLVHTLWKKYAQTPCGN